MLHDMQKMHSTRYFINPQIQLKGFACLFPPLNFMQFDVKKSDSQHTRTPVRKNH